MDTRFCDGSEAVSYTTGDGFAETDSFLGLLTGGSGHKDRSISGIDYVSEDDYARQDTCMPETYMSDTYMREDDYLRQDDYSQVNLTSQHHHHHAGVHIFNNNNGLLLKSEDAWPVCALDLGHLTSRYCHSDSSSSDSSRSSGSHRSSRSSSEEASETTLGCLMPGLVNTCSPSTCPSWSPLNTVVVPDDAQPLHMPGVYSLSPQDLNLVDSMSPQDLHMGDSLSPEVLHVVDSLSPQDLMLAAPASPKAEAETPGSASFMLYQVPEYDEREPEYHQQYECEADYHQNGVEYERDPEYHQHGLEYGADPQHESEFQHGLEYELGAVDYQHESAGAVDESGRLDEPYAKLIYKAFMSQPDHAMTLQDIYQWFRDNTTKASSEKGGWQNSIRHNLSMNAAFQKRQRHEQSSVDGASCIIQDSKRANEWVLEEWAVRYGVQSTTRYRKGASRRRGGAAARSQAAASSHASAASHSAKRAVSGRKGGCAARDSRIRAAGHHPDHQQQQQQHHNQQYENHHNNQHDNQHHNQHSARAAAIGYGEDAVMANGHHAVYHENQTGLYHPESQHENVLHAELGVAASDGLDEPQAPFGLVGHDFMAAMYRDAGLVHGFHDVALGYFGPAPGLEAQEPLYCDWNQHAGL